MKVYTIQLNENQLVKIHNAVLVHLDVRKLANLKKDKELESLLDLSSPEKNIPGDRDHRTVNGWCL